MKKTLCYFFRRDQIEKEISSNNLQTPITLEKKKGS